MHRVENEKYNIIVCIILSSHFLNTQIIIWEDNIKMDLQEVGWCCGDWMELAQDRDRWRALVSTIKNFRGP
jgi:hypothetical protein